jgi:hypothetical protein
MISINRPEKNPLINHLDENFLAWKITRFSCKSGDEKFLGSTKDLSDKEA